MEQEMTFVADIEGRSETCTVLFTFSSDVTGADYMLYTPDDLDSGKPPRLSAARYDPDNLTKLMPLQGDMDRDVVQSFINYISTTPREELEKTTPLI